jgi:hypothetical protein
MYEVVYFKDGKQYSCDFQKEKEAIKFAIKMEGTVLKEKVVLDDFSSD